MVSGYPYWNFLHAWKRKSIWSIKYQLMQQECTTRCVFSVSYQQVFGDLSDYVLKMTTSNNSALIFLITDQYWKVSIKSCECNKQGGSGSIGITAMRPEQEVPKQQKKHFSLDSNKEELLEFLLQD